ncbi:MAG: topoisomerase DNA-binding C4 zinc finger domain-containing protein [Desulfovibrionaceae bacterium]|nr:topoisomerase DNA-binding C4 zinc finger domain-containing protein [Desulfovibrionaceae bacterium]
MAEQKCPLCQEVLVRRARKNDPNSYYFACSGYAKGCTFACDDCDGEPFLKTCPECGKILSYKISRKNGRPYVACFNKDGHASGEVLFFREDGSRDPVPSSTFYCPECKGKLLYRAVRRGADAGKKNVFVCPNEDGHRDGKAHFFEDKDGSPVYPVEQAVSSTGGQE